MPRKRLDVSLSHDEFEDLNNALEDHRDGFKRMAQEAINGFGLEPAYWTGRAEEVEGLRESVHEHSADEPDVPPADSELPREAESARDLDPESEPRN